VVHTDSLFSSDNPNTLYSMRILFGIIVVHTNNIIVDSVSTNFRKHPIIFVFSIGCMVRSIPDMVAYPYPIGYDVINYYIPVITNFQEHWSHVSEQFPLYILILYLFHTGTNLQPQTLVSVSGIILYGLFSISLFLMSRRLLGLHEVHSLYLTLFVIFQLPVLRTAWDLHKDVFSLTLLLISVSLMYPLGAKIRKYSIIGSSIIASFAVSLDKMVGALFVASLMIYGFVVRTKHITLLSLLIAGFFVAIITSEYGSVRRSLQILPDSTAFNQLDLQQELYNPKNLLILLIVVNGPLLVPAGFGFMRSDNRLLRIAVVITAIGSFSWLIFPDRQSLAADRWIFLFGIFLSIFAGYGIVEYSQTRVHTGYRTCMLSVILGLSVAAGLIYEIMPYQFESFSEVMLGWSIEPFGPATMQFNSIPVNDTSELIKTVYWINKNTPNNAMVFGEKHWRGWMDIELQGDRLFMYGSNQYDTLKSMQDCHLNYCYIVTHLSESLRYMNKKVQTEQVYQNKLFTVYEIGSTYDMKGGLSSVHINPNQKTRTNMSLSILK
jgi:hypothetical protein